MKKASIAGLTIAIGAGALLGASTQNAQREIRATRLVVVDSAGREVMVLSANPAGEGVIEFLDGKGKPVMKVDAGRGSLLRTMSDAASKSDSDSDSMNDSMEDSMKDFMEKHMKDAKTARDSDSDSQTSRDSKSDSQSSRDSDSSSSSQSKRDSDSDSDSSKSSQSKGGKSSGTSTTGSSSGSTNTNGSRE
jgi:hypothetical protein